MKDINTVALTGRLTKDAMLKYTTSGMAICELSIACNRSVKKGDEWQDEASFFDCTIIGKFAEGVASKLLKGTAVTIQGELRQERWTTQDGGNRSKVGIIVQNLSIQRPATQQTQQTQQQPRHDAFPQDDSHIPF